MINKKFYFSFFIFLILIYINLFSFAKFINQILFFIININIISMNKSVAFN